MRFTPGVTLTTNLPSDQTLALARQAATDLDFTIHIRSAWEFSARKGTLGRSLLLGPFMAYCRFRISVIQFEGDEVDLVLQRNVPWWTGFTGVGKVRAWALRLARLIQTRIEEQGGKVLQSKEFW